jgi:hypothetical protein|nr:hypothetical protein [Candidatus Cloacimonadota bacterium]
LIGKSFQQAVEIFNNQRDECNPVILIGVRRNCKKGNNNEMEKSHVILNPKLNTDSHNGKFDKFEKGDSLVVIAQSYPDLLNMK